LLAALAFWHLLVLPALVLLASALDGSRKWLWAAEPFPAEGIKNILASDAALTAYAQTLMPRVYDDFIGTAKAVLIPEHREGLRNHNES